MFSSSLRRAARSSPLPCAIPTRPSTPSIAAATSQCIDRRTHHQRRHSSSKPPIPPNSDGSKNIDSPARPAGKDITSGVKEGPEKRAEGKITKRRSKDDTNSASLRDKDDISYALPIVPSTQHLHPNDIDLARLFSIHRPLSVTSSIPTTVTPEAFASIFSTQKLSKPKPAEVIYTLSSALNSLESELQQNQQRQHSPTAGEGDLRTAITQASVSNAESAQTHLDGTPPLNDLKISIQEIAKTFRPFNPPPAPVPMSSEEGDLVEDRNSEVGKTKMTHQRFSTTLSVQESVNADGHKTYSAPTSPLHEMTSRKELIAPSTFPPLRYMERLRQLREQMNALSTRRQRKLKMKKHKLKKLRKRTRNLRRRLERN